MTKLTSEQAMEAMRLFLTKQWERVPDTQVADVLSNLDDSIWVNQRTADPAAEKEWHECVERVLARKVEAAE